MHEAAPYLSAVVGQHGGQWPADDLAAVDDRHLLATEAVAFGKGGIVGVEVLQRLDDSEWRAGQHTLLRLRLVHVALAWGWGCGGGGG